MAVAFLHRRATNQTQWWAGRRGLTLAEGGFALLLLTLIVGGAWHWVTATYDGLKINVSIEQLRMLVPAVRDRQRADNAPTGRDDLLDANAMMPLQLQALQNEEHGAGHAGLFHAWRGLIWAYPGHADLWAAPQEETTDDKKASGKAKKPAEFTLMLEKIPASVCPVLVGNMLQISEAKPIAILVTPNLGHGREFCMIKDSHCDLAAEFTPRDINLACGRGNPLYIAITYAK